MSRIVGMPQRSEKGGRFWRVVLDVPYLLILNTNLLVLEYTTRILIILVPISQQHYPAFTADSVANHNCL